MLFTFAQNPLHKIRSLNIFDELTKQIETYSLKGPVILCGDFNARTGNLEDFVKFDNCNGDYVPVPDDYITDESWKRNNSDHTINMYGEQLVELCLSAGLRILNGRMKNDLEGKITCYQPRKDNTVGYSVVDYVIASEKCINDIVLFDVVPLNTFSDHCLLEFSLCVKYEITNVIEDYTKKVSGEATNYKWSREYSNAYLLEYECGDIQQKLNDFMGMSLDNGNVDHILQCFNNIIYTAADRTLPKIPQYRSKTKHLSLRKKRYKWFGDDCYQLKKKFKSTCEALARDRNNPYLRGLYCKQTKTIQT